MKIDKLGRQKSHNLNDERIGNSQGKNIALHENLKRLENLISRKNDIKREPKRTECLFL